MLARTLTTHCRLTAGVNTRSKPILGKASEFSDRAFCEKCGVTHTFANNGQYDATLVTVTDDDGAATTSNLTITVNNVAPTVDTEATKTGNEGSAVEFVATVADPGTDALTITWDFGDGSEVVTTDYSESPTSHNATASHTYASNGTYTATVSVTDSDGAVSESIINVTINNTAPVIEFLTGDTPINEGDTATFSAIATDAGNDSLTYTWDFGNGETGSGADVSHTFSDNGDYTVTLTVRDSDGAEAVQTHEITVNNTVPVITSLTGDPRVDEGDLASFSVSAGDAGDDTLAYVWDFGDGSDTVMGENAEHIYIDNGLYETTVTVTDDDGAFLTQSLTITVDNVAPIADPWLDEESIEGDTVEFNVSFSDPGRLDTHTLTWDFGDGSEPATTEGTQTSVSHVYTDNGTYTASVVITDSNGASTTNTMTVTVNNAAPAIDSLTGDRSVDEGKTANFAVAASDPGADELTYTWDFGDGSTATGTDTAHTFTQNGSYTVTATVRDDDGASTSSTIDVTVNNVTPTIESITGDTEVDEGERAYFSANATDPGNDELTYTWDFGDGSETVTGRDATHVFADNGDYTVTLSVIDDDGASISQTLEVTVENQAPVVEWVVDRNVKQNQAGNFSAIATDPGNDELTYTWDLGDGSATVTGRDITHTYSETGIYTVTLTVDDGDGAVVTQSSDITVRPNLDEGVFIADSSGQITVDYLFDGGAYQGELGVFSLEGMEAFTDGSSDYIREAAKRATANNSQGHVLIKDRNQGARFGGQMPNEPQDWNRGNYPGSQTFNLTPNSKFALILVPNGKISDLSYNPNARGDKKPFFSIPAANGDNSSGQFSALIPQSNTYVAEDQSISSADRDYNDIIFQIKGATGELVSVDSQIATLFDWRNSPVGQQVIEQAIATNSLVPIVELGEDLTIESNQVASFNGKFSDSDVRTLIWDFGDGTTLETEYEPDNLEFLQPTHQYSRAGTYELTFTVIDKCGNVGSDRASVTVNPDPNGTTKIRLVSEDLDLKVYEADTLVEQVRGQNNRPVPNGLERFSLTAIDSWDYYRRVDSTRLNKNDGVGVYDGSDFYSFWKKRIDGDEGLVIGVQPTADYNSATDALITVDKVRTAGRNGGQVKVVALLGDTVVTQQSYNLSTQKNQLDFVSEKPFDSILLKTGDRRTAFTWREIELSTAIVEIPTVNTLSVIQDQLKLQVFEDDELVKQVNGQQNQQIPDHFERVTIRAIDSLDYRPRVDKTFHDRGEGIGITDGDDYNFLRKKRIEGNETLEISILPTYSYNSASSVIISVNKIASLFNGDEGGKVKAIALSNGVVVAQQTYSLDDDSASLTLKSDRSFDTIQLKAGDTNTKFTWTGVEFQTVLD